MNEGSFIFVIPAYLINPIGDIDVLTLPERSLTRTGQYKKEDYSTLVHQLFPYVLVHTFIVMKFTLVSLSLLFASSSVSALPGKLEAQDDDIETQAVDLHNSYRAKYGADAVTWDSSIASQAQAYAEKCVFEHSTGADFIDSGTDGVGENLAAGSGDYGISDAVNSWMDEAYNNPGFSSDTGHFTQCLNSTKVVWKATKQIGCGIGSCASGTIFPDSDSKYVVCQYAPPGNYDGQFPSSPDVVKVHVLNLLVIAVKTSVDL
ncbi:hypothetical protein D9758_018050 [Tetrapyrgos nigripes]|uniref:SCP domain-containing protein n=1 Tax=Tetrapyrgos nigripes TaxID=182062 RepID=A0A8H5BRL1_9AGAR|nr:hypothetical protein D9758_018050 [Tetrapyrgos nigripes]